MCGRIALFTPPHRLARLLEATLAAGVEAAFVPSWNVAPTRTLFGVAQRPTGRELDAFRWGLVPNWAKDPSVGARTFNARAETVLDRPSFATSFERRRLLVPMDGFFEWDRRRADAKVPHFFVRADGRPLVVAGLYDRWRDRAIGGPWLATCTILTTSPGDDVDGIHDRMPVVLEEGAFDLWLDPTSDVEAARSLCVPAAAGTLVHHPVDARVGNVANDWPELIDAV